VETGAAKWNLVVLEDLVDLRSHPTAVRSVGARAGVNSIMQASQRQPLRNAIWALFGAAVLVLPGTVAAQDDETCLMCHADASLFEGMERAATLVVTAESAAGSVHAEVGMSCVDCHQDLAGVDDWPHSDQLEPVNCGMCHDDVQGIYDRSLHGYAVQRGNPRAPTCINCHGAHDVTRSSNPRSKTHKVHLPATCAACHGTVGLTTDRYVKLPQSFEDYAKSVHGQGTQRGIAAAASCADCHGVHDLRGAADPQSRINIRNVASTCGTCHPDIQVEYENSIHGRALNAGVTDSPTCTGCHGEHMILSPRNPAAKVASEHLATQTCGGCHNDPLIIAKYNLKGRVVESYEDSYHGWATTRRSQEAASCASCHTAHSVLPESHPDSTISPNHVVETCRQCHPRADERFAASYTHETASARVNPINRIISQAYIWAIVVIIGGMVLHNLVIMNYFMVQRRREQQGSAWLRRFDAVQIVQHFLLFVAFAMLVITGFALRFPGAWWVGALDWMGMTEHLRANLHRTFAVVMIVVSLSHIWYIFLTRRGWQEFQAMLPRWRDVSDLFGNLGYHTWQTRKRVKFGRYDYSQKAEYWALIWGTIVMIFTGFVLWFPAAFVKIFPVWIVSVSQTVHYYEAWLATLAILVWHIFFVIFHPEQYPMSWTWLTGKMSVESVKEHHAGWYEEEKDKVQPPTKTPRPNAARQVSEHGMEA